MTQSPSADPVSLLTHFESRRTDIDGIRLHYVIGGSGKPLLLIHGFAESWYTWSGILPALAGHFRVIVPDLPGIGSSDIPDVGYDKKTIAALLHGLIRQLGFGIINIAGHDIGLMVAYSYAAQFSGEVGKLALMDAIIPGIDPWWSQYAPKAWWWQFFTWPVAPTLIQGKEREFLTGFWTTQAFNKDPFTDAEIAEIINAYSRPGSIAAGFKWFATFDQDARDNRVFSKQKLQMPVLAIGGDHHTGKAVADHARSVATNVRELIIRDSGHWLVQEQPQQVLDGFLDFFPD